MCSIGELAERSDEARTRAERLFQQSLSSVDRLTQLAFEQREQPRMHAFALKSIQEGRSVVSFVTVNPAETTNRCAFRQPTPRVLLVRCRIVLGSLASPSSHLIDQKHSIACCREISQTILRSSLLMQSFYRTMGTQPLETILATSCAKPKACRKNSEARPFPCGSQT